MGRSGRNRRWMWLVLGCLAMVLSWAIPRKSGAQVDPNGNASANAGASASASANANANANADPNATNPPAEKIWKGPPAEVAVGIYINQITAFSLKDNKFSVDFWIWFRWTHPDVKPYASFEIANGQIANKGEPEISVVKGQNYAVLRVVADITNFWDVSRYPLDDHPVPIVIEDSESEDFKLKYVADGPSCGLDDDVRVPGWTMGKSTAIVEVSKKHSNYGDISLPSDNESRYSSFRFTINLERHGASYFLKLFFGLVVAALIGFLAFFIKPTDVDPRFGLGVGAIFAAVASEYIVSGALPDTNVIALADKLHIVAFGFIFISLVQSTWSLAMFENGQEERSKSFDRLAWRILPPLYFLISGLAVLIK